jgi:hypothetical protein
MATRAPGSGQRRCNPAADALGCASDDCDSACEFAHCVVLPWCKCAAGDARRQFLPGTWTIMLTVVSDLNTRTSNGNAMFIEFQKTALDRS